MAVTTVPTDDTGRRAKALASTILREYGVFVALAALCLYAAIWAPGFFDSTNVQNTLRRASILGLVAIGQTVVLMVRGVDLSVGSMIALTAVGITSSLGPWQGFGVVLLLAVVVGSVNTWLVVRRQVPPFVATFGMLVLLEGLRLVWTRGSASGSAPDGLVDLARGTIGPVPVPVIVWIAASVVAAVATTRTVAGRRLVLSGANERMAELSGIRVGKMKWAAFALCSVLAVISGAFLTGFVGYVDRFIGQGSDLDSITAALLGGARFGGGEGSFLGTMGGALLLSSLLTLIVVLRLQPELQLVAKGLVLIAALAVQGMRRR
jgi:ribose/xylose/arabinose/galactoside ABC-type transport system permease subunit